MHTIGRPFDVRPFRSGLFENAMERNNASHAELDGGLLNRRNIKLKHLVPFFWRWRPNNAWLTKNDRRFRARALQPHENVRIDLTKFLNGGSFAGARQCMPDVIDSDFYGNQLRLVATSASQRRCKSEMVFPEIPLLII